VDFTRYVLDLELARPRPAGGGGGWPENLVVLSSTVSTNSVARGMASDFESEGLALVPTLVLALEQTGGRGRQGRTWSSPRGRGVYATLAQPYAEAELLPALPLLVGVGLCRALAPHLPHGCRLKWPNDLLVPNGDGASGGGGGRKIGGVLIEARVQPEEGCVAIIGFGVNHGQRRDELPEGATSLLVERDGGAPGPGLADLTWELVAGVEAELAHAGDLPYAVAAYRSLSIHRPGDPLLWRAGEQEVAGTFTGFDDMGRLRLQPAGGGEPMVLSAGEVIES
jgi:BirA family biotin operon repressor/biotin-[acetyl-CoA-carboxylase] ligase